MKRFFRPGIMALGLIVLTAHFANAQALVRQRSVHGVSEAQYQTFISTVEKEGMRPIWVQVGGTAAQPKFSATAIDDGASHPWAARHNQTGAAWQKEFDAWTGKGYRLICQCGYLRGKDVNFAGVFVKEPNAPRSEARYGQTPAEYQATFDSLSKKSYWPAVTNGYSDGKGLRFASVFVDDKVNDFFAYQEQTVAQYQKVFDDLPLKGYRAVAISAYPTAGGVRFGSVFARGGTQTEWLAKHNLTGEQYQQEYDRWTAKGFVPVQIVGYQDGAALRFSALFHVLVKGGGGVKYPLPTTGTEAAGMKPFDDAMQKFMKERSIRGGTLAVLKDGKVLLAKGYGYRDSTAGKLMGPEQPLRIASIGKPITLAGLLKLIAQGKISGKTKVVDYLGITAPPGKTMDKRWKDITIQDLIDHKGGFDRDKFGDPMFMTTKIAAALGKTGPASAQDVINYMAGQPLDLNPGAKYVYSNFGYCLLGRVIEKATGKSYTNYMKSEFFGPLGLKTMDLGRSLPKDRGPNEPVYLDPHSGPNVLQGGKGNVPAPDGTFYLEAMDAHGGLISSAPDLARWFSAYWMDGTARKGNGRGYQFFGSLPGTWTLALQRPDGYVITALFNQREDPSGLKYDAILDMMNKAADSVK